MTIRKAAFLAVLVVPLAVPCLLHPASAQRFGEAIAITEVEVPVQVLHRGEPVRGLTVDDFEIFDDGEPADVISFRTVEVGAPEVIEGAEDEAPAGAPAAPPSTDGRHVLYLFDFLFSRSHHVERALYRGRDRIVDQLRPEDRVAVGYLSGNGARLILGFTNDREEIRTALELVEAMADGRRKDAAEGFRRLAQAQGFVPAADDDPVDDVARARVDAAAPTRAGALGRRFGAAAAIAMMGGVEAAPADGWGASLGGVAGAPGGFGDGDSQSNPIAARASETNPFALGRGVVTAEAASRVRAQTDQIAEIATLLRDVPGQKHMFLLSHGFSSELLYGIGVPERPLVLRYLRGMFESLRRTGWTLHAFDTGGIPEPFADWRFSNTGTLFYLANETGGHLLANYNRLPDATERLLLKISVTYVLTIRPPADIPADGRLRRIEVRLKDRPWGTRLYHRTGYYAPKPIAERSPLERQLDTIDLLLGEREIEEIPIGLRVEASPEEGGLAPIEVQIDVPGALFADEDGPNAELQVQLYAVDPEGGVQDVWMRRIVLDREKVGPRLVEAGLTVSAELSVPPGKHRLRALVRHPRSDRLTLTTTDLTVRDAGPSR